MLSNPAACYNLLIFAGISSLPNTGFLRSYDVLYDLIYVPASTPDCQSKRCLPNAVPTQHLINKTQAQSESRAEIRQRISTQYVLVMKVLGSTRTTVIVKEASPVIRVLPVGPMRMPTKAKLTSCSQRLYDTPRGRRLSCWKEYGQV